ncbi:uncharacterized protein LOC121765070 [Salvia splendens]|uniref:uncharacterized protein LOC121765070 n=1 Tax=Salvia splendens TaxID=180675 RepID=UPI001C265FB0|nr:uncharacterized protein LOC121765070 [Salvia splendens]
MPSTYHGPSTSERPTREATPALHIGQPRRPDQSGKASVDPITLGFAKLNARLDSMDRRVDILESRMNTNDRRLGKLRPPQRPDPEPPYGLPDRGGADWDKQHRRYTQPTYRRPQHHQSDRYPPPPPYQPDRRRPYHLHQTRYPLPEHYQPFDYGEVITHTHSPTRDGDGELCDSEDSILDAELCDSENSILEAVAKKLMDRGLPSENWGSREGRDGRLEDQQVPSFDEIDPPCSPDMSKETEEEALLDDVEEVDSIEEVKKAVVARVTSQDVVGNCLGEKGELRDSDVARIFQRPTLLAIDARMVPPRNYTACLGVRGRVNKLHVLALNFDDCFDPTLMIFYGEGEVTRPTIRYAFDPGGDASPSLCFQLSSLVRGSHLEDKVDFNRGGVVTIPLYLRIPQIFSYLFIIPHIF